MPVTYSSCINSDMYFNIRKKQLAINKADSPLPSRSSQEASGTLGRCSPGTIGNSCNLGPS